MTPCSVLEKRHISSHRPPWAGVSLGSDLGACPDLSTPRDPSKSTADEGHHVGRHRLLPVPDHGVIIHEELTLLGGVASG